MNIIPITDKNQLNFFQSQKNMAQFLQSWEWGEFQKAVGRKIWRLGIVAESTRLANGQANNTKEHQLLAAITVIKHNLPFGKSYLYCPRLTIEGEDSYPRLQEEIKKIAQQENAIFIKIECVSKTLMPHASFLMTRSRPIQPPTTLLLNLTKSEDELLSHMHQKTRYNIRLAERHGVKVKESKDITEFLTLNHETKARDKFKSHSDDYYRKMFEILGVNQQCNNLPRRQAGVTMPANGWSASGWKQCRLKLFTAYYDNQAIASNLTLFFGDTATYLHGASSDEHRNLMSPHLLQWQVIKYAKSQGYHWYDFWGVNPVKLPQGGTLLQQGFNRVNPNSTALRLYGFRANWQGFTRFKRGFVSDATGQEVNFPDCLDLIIQPFWYQLYKISKYLKL